MSDDLTQKLPSDAPSAPDTEPTILTLMEQLRHMQELADKRYVESQNLIASVRDDVNQKAQQKYEHLINRVQALQTSTDSHFRKQEHLILALNDNVLRTRGEQRELFERISILEEKAS